MRDEAKIALIALVALVLVVLIGITTSGLLNPSNDTNNTTINDTNNTTINETNNTTQLTNKTSTNKKSSSKSSNVESVETKENYQAGDGSTYKEVSYKDGNFRQYDSNGNLIGSSYDSDQAQLKKQAGDDWPGN